MAIEDIGVPTRHARVMTFHHRLLLYTAHREANIVGCGLETQFLRCDDGKVQWICVDLPEAIAVRERFIRPSERCKHVPGSVLDLSWMDAVEAEREVFVTAQGLFMYFEEPKVKELVVALVNRFPGVELMFDAIPPWFSKKTVTTGFDKTEHYRSPPMRRPRRGVQATAGSRSTRLTLLHTAVNQTFTYAEHAVHQVLDTFITHPLREVPPCSDSFLELPV